MLNLILVLRNQWPWTLKTANQSFHMTVLTLWLWWCIIVSSLLTKGSMLKRIKTLKQLCDLDLEHCNLIFFTRHSSLWWYTIKLSLIGKGSLIVKILQKVVFWTWTYMTLQLLMMQHLSKCGYKRCSNSGDILRTNSNWNSKQTPTSNLYTTHLHLSWCTKQVWLQKD